LKKKLSKIKGLDASKLNRFINGLAKKLDPLTLILHGSLVKGEFVDELSDIDVIVISPKLENVELKERFILVLKEAQKHFLRVDATAYTPQEFLKMIKELNPFALDAVFYGISLYDKNGFWKNAVKEFKKCKRKYNLRKTESNGWVWKTFVKIFK
jgi:predicted nucleotidyltransferase